MESSIVNILISLLTLTLLEVILGVDNLVFISISSMSLPREQQKLARRLGLLFALLTRLLLLATAFLLIKLTQPLFTFQDLSFSVRDLLLLAGGLFLLVKATGEIHNEMEPSEEQAISKGYGQLWLVVVQIGILDIVFSLDSVFTAIALTHLYWVMAAAITIAIMAMIVASEPLSRLIHEHPSIKMLALSFILLIGVMLIADGLQFHIPRGYIYFAISFSLLVEILNQVVKSRRA